MRRLAAGLINVSGVIFFPSPFQKCLIAGYPDPKSVDHHFVKLTLTSFFLTPIINVACVAEGLVTKSPVCVCVYVSAT